MTTNSMLHVELCSGDKSFRDNLSRSSNVSSAVRSTKYKQCPVINTIKIRPIKTRHAGQCLHDMNNTQLLEYSL